MPNQASVCSQKLRSVVKDMDCLSQDGFSQVASIAKLALRSLEHPEGHRRLEDLAQAFRAICLKAQDTQDYINAMAEEVGCNFIDIAERRRWEASRKASAEQEVAA